MTTIYLLNMTYPTLDPLYCHTLLAFSTREKAEEALAREQSRDSGGLAVYVIEEKPMF